MAVSLILLDLENGGVKVPGDATMAGFENLIVVYSFSWSFDAETVEKLNANPVTTTKAGKVSLRKNFDRSSAALFRIMETDNGRTPLEATLKFLDVSSLGQGAMDCVLEVTLTGCHIDSVSLRASDGGKSVEVTEEVVLSFQEKMSLDYRSYNASSHAREKVVNATIMPTGVRK